MVYPKLEDTKLLYLQGNLLKNFKKDVCVVMLENQHWPQSDTRVSTSFNVQPVSLGHGQKLIALWCVKRDEGAKGNAPRQTKEQSTHIVDIVDLTMSEFNAPTM